MGIGCSVLRLGSLVFSVMLIPASSPELTHGYRRDKIVQVSSSVNVTRLCRGTGDIFDLPPSSTNSITTAHSTRLPPILFSSSIAACAVPPVAIRSSIRMMRSFFSMESACISIQLVPVSYTHLRAHRDRTRSRMPSSA